MDLLRPRPRTSFTHPLEIDVVRTDLGGRIGLSICPGKVQAVARTGAWRRDLDADLRRMVAAGAKGLVTLMEADELVALEVPELGPRARAAGLTWWHLPIADRGVPDATWEASWAEAGPAIRTRLARHELVVVHCKGGLGRTGLVAARLLVDLGARPADAIRRVRIARRRPDARRTTIENATQEAWVRQLSPGPR